MPSNPWRVDESFIPGEYPPREKTHLLLILGTFLIGFSVSVLYSTMLTLETIPLGAFAGLFILPPVVGYYAFLTPTDPPLAKHLAFLTIAFVEIASCAALYFHWKSIPIPKFHGFHFLDWPFVRTHNDGYVGDAVWIAIQCFLAGVIASYGMILAVPKIKSLFRTNNYIFKTFFIINIF